MPPSFDLPPQLRHLINTHYIFEDSNSGKDDDQIIWGLTPTGRFIVKLSRVTILSLKLPRPRTSIYTWIWKLKLPPKMHTFLWLIIYYRLPINAYLHPMTILSFISATSPLWRQLQLLHHRPSLLGSTPSVLYSWLKHLLHWHHKSVHMSALPRIIFYAFLLKNF